MIALPLAEIESIKPFVEFLDACGASTGRHLEAARIPPEMVEAGKGRISKAQVYRFLRRSAYAEGIPDLGYRVGASYGVNALGRIGQTIRGAATLKEAIDTFASLVAGWFGANRVWLEPEGDQIWLKNAAYDPLRLQRDLANQCGLMELIDLVRLAAGSQWTPRRASIEMRPNRVHEQVGSLANAEVRFHPWETGVAFPAEFLARPLRPQSDGGTTSSSPTDSQSFSAALGKLLKDRLRYVGNTSLPLAAEIAELSPRSLQRRLADEGLTYRRLIDRVRFETAREMLEDPTVTSNEIASLLDYSGVNNFLRAFRRFTGMTPTAYRQVLRNGSVGSINLQR